VSAYQIDLDKQRAYAEQNNWILFPDEFPCPNLAKKVTLDIDIELRRPPVFIELDGTFWTTHFYGFTFADLKAKCAQLGLTPQGRTKQAYVGELTRYFRKIVKA
jgi:hypothetical protein